jgi:UDP-N-acetylmuramoylalanine--D-glutamate ligase
MTPIDIFRGKNVALFGLGGSGLATADQLMAGGARVIAWDDNAAQVEKARAAGHYANDLRQLDWRAITALVLSPGVPLTHPEPHWSAKLAAEAGVEIIGDVELFCRDRAKRAPSAPFVAITGTNGKSTTTALIAHLLAHAGRDVAMGGNIGTPVLALPPPAPARIHVVECSSYQIDLAPTLRPTIGVLMNITPDHIDRHGTLEHYAAVKERLIAGSEIAIIGVDDPLSAAIAARHAETGRRTIRIAIGGDAPAELCINGREIVGASGVLASLDGIGSLRGDHNAQNAAAAIGVAMELGVPLDVIQAGLRTFPGLAHRMEQVGRIGKATAINDSKATNADSTEKALLAFERGIFWIAGGKAKEGGITSLAPLFPRLAKAYLIGAAAAEFAATLAGEVDAVQAGTLEEAVKLAARDAAYADFPEPVILLSPSCASFDQFPNFEVRGSTFRALIEQQPGYQPL